MQDDNGTTPATGRPPRRWPLWLIAAPAAVAIWSGWVGLGALCGFGTIRLLPGIIDSLKLDTAITLPVGVEAYGAFALGAWMAPGTPQQARKFARWSAIGALTLGCSGQVIFHLLAAAGVSRAPWPVIVGVSCMPVIVLGFAAALMHLLRLPAEPEAEAAGETVTRTVSPDVIEAAKARLRSALAQRFKLSDNELRAQFRLTRAEATTVRQEVAAELNGSAVAGG